MSDNSRFFNSFDYFNLLFIKLLSTMSGYFVYCLLLLWSGQILALSDEMQEMAKVLHDACVDETGVDEKFIEMCRQGNFPDDANLKCYMKCLITKVPIMTDEGEIDVETVVSLVPDEYLEIAEPILRGCGTVKGADDCDTAYLTNKCWYSKGPEYYFLV